MYIFRGCNRNFLLRLAILLNSSILCCLLLGILRKNPTFHRSVIWRTHFWPTRKPREKSRGVLTFIVYLVAVLLTSWPQIEERMVVHQPLWWSGFYRYFLQKKQQQPSTTKQPLGMHKTLLKMGLPTTKLNWWQLKHFGCFHPDPWGRWTHFDDVIFRVGLVQPPTGYFRRKNQFPTPLKCNSLALEKW